jgi:hypothetical protein
MACKERLCVAVADCVFALCVEKDKCWNSKENLAEWTSGELAHMWTLSTRTQNLKEVVLLDLARNRKRRKKIETKR